jgi:transcriptional regulator with XRE-family HTH domain
MAAEEFRMSSGMELVQPLEATGDESPLAVARLHRQLTLAETARRAGLSEEEARWLEEGRVYRFPSPDHALLAALLYGTALGIDNREARRLAGLSVPTAPADRKPLLRLIAVGALLIGLAVFLAFLLIARAGGGHRSTQPGLVLPPPWRVNVDVLNGSGDFNYTRRVASHVQAFGYAIKKVGRADSFSYPQTAVYFPPGCDALALRLAKQLGVATKPLPGGTGACELFVIVGPARGP